MHKWKQDEDYQEIVSDIMNLQEFSEEMSQIPHHDSNRLQHSLKVSYYSYVISKYLKLDYIEVARAGLLHDFYLDSVSKQKKVKDKVKLYTVKHPKDALENASYYFDLSDKEKDIIRTHMFPVDVKVPKYAESWIVSLVDKGVSAKEFGNKFASKLVYASNLYFILLLNIMKMV